MKSIGKLYSADKKVYDVVDNEGKQEYRPIPVSMYQYLGARLYMSVDLPTITLKEIGL